MGLKWVFRLKRKHVLLKNSAEKREGPMNPHPNWPFSGQRTDRWLVSRHGIPAADQELIIRKFLPDLGNELGTL